MNETTRRILMNPEIIALNQDPLGIPAERKIGEAAWNVFVKPLSNGDVALAILNRSDIAQQYSLIFEAVGLHGSYEIRDVWEQRVIGKGKKWAGEIRGHETKVFRLHNVRPTN